MTTVDLSGIAGAVVRPGDDTWDAARVFHSGVGEPQLIVRAANVDDVRAAVRHAAGVGASVVVRGGGHSAWGELPGGVVIDLAALATIDVDVASARVSIGGGAVWGSVAASLGDHGLAVSSGDTASVGVGGLTLGGGIGWMVRAWGLACDQLVGAQLVTADGEVVEVSETERPDLLWALRGGGGNVGVVTRFDFAAHALPAGVVFTTLRLQPESNATAVLRAVRDVMRDAPRELTVTYMDVPAMDPSAPAGATVTAVWIGEGTDDARIEEARSLLAPVRGVAGVTEDECAVRPYAEILLESPAYDPAQPMPGFVGGNVLFVELDDDAVGRLVAFRAAHPASVVFARSLGGAYGDVAEGGTAFAARNAAWFAMAGAFDIPGLLGDDERARALEEWDAIDRLGVGVYGNFTTSTDAAWATRMYPDDTRRRLAAIKREWDPANLFSRNHNVPPA